MADFLFYHLEKTSLENVLPGLLEKSIERGWACVVQAGSEERVDALDLHLWVYREDSFLPHGRLNDNQKSLHPVFLTCSDENPNQARVRFLVDGAAPLSHEALEGYERVVFIFDGHDPEALNRAREQWRLLKASSHNLTYWQQNEQGRWEKKA